MPIHGYPGNVITANPTAPTVNAASGVWTTEQQLIAMAAGNWPMAATQISRSLRFNSADSAYLNRTPASAGNRRTWTWSGWIKRGGLGVTQGFISAGTNGNQIFFAGFSGTDDKIYIHNGVQGVSVESWAVTSAVYRDPSAWYHIVLVVDTTNATAANRVILYVNGVAQTLSNHSGYNYYPTQNYQTAINNTVVHELGYGYDNSSKSYYNGYITEVNFIDGSALTPSSFGFNSSDTGVWSPKQYIGPYGTNGFYVNFSDNSNTTAATLGKDYSGNGNNWTPNNFSVTAGAGNDSLTDVPTLTSDTTANYWTLNPLFPSSDSVFNGNLSISTSGSAGGYFSIPQSTKFYFEVDVTGNYYVAFMNNQTSTVYLAISQGWTDPGAPNAYYYRQSALNGTSIDTTNPGGNQLRSGTFGFAVDMIAGFIYIYDDTTLIGTCTLSSTVSSIDNCLISNNTGTISRTQKDFNFGQRSFTSPPSGFKALNTFNLPTPTIGATSTTQANDYMNVVLWTGNGSTQNITGVGFQPDFVWAKKRSGAESHGLYDAVRGASNRLVSNTTAAAVTDAGVSAFLSDGFSISGTDSGVTNDNGATYVGWNWNAGGSNATNTSGTITSTVRANTTSGFSIVTYTGTGANATVGHGLGVVPKWVIVKNRTGGDWKVYTETTGNTTQGFLNDSLAFQGSSPTLWNSTTPTSTVFSIGTNAGVNGSGNAIVAYCFAPVAGYSAFGSYTGNGSADGPFVYLGFRPRFVMIKSTTSAEGWNIADTARDTSNPELRLLFPNTATAEFNSGSTWLDGVSNGFKIRYNGSPFNTSGATYIYMAFAESPFKYALAR